MSEPKNFPDPRAGCSHVSRPCRERTGRSLGDGSGDWFEDIVEAAMVASFIPIALLGAGLIRLGRWVRGRELEDRP